MGGVLSEGAALEAAFAVAMSGPRALPFCESKEPQRPVADCPNEGDRAMHIMQTQPLLAWPADYRADYCRLVHLNAADPKAPKMNSPQVFYNWKRNGFPGFDQPETDE